MKHALNSKTAFVFAGGGSLGAVQVGMLKAFTQTGIIPDFIVGASVGAINAAFFASDPTPNGADRLEQIWLKIRRENVFPVSPLRTLFGFMSFRNYICSPKPLKIMIQQHLTHTRLENLPVPTVIMATDLFSGNEVPLSHGSVVDSLLAGSAIPAVFPPVKVGEQFLVDGGITNNTPISAAVARGANRVILFPTGICCAQKIPPKGVVEMVLQTISIAMSHRLAADIERFRNDVDIVLLPVLCPLDVSMFDFTRTADLINRAEENVLDWLENGGLTGGADLHRLIPHHH
ncbi:MAG: patatin-like phospholipase family protein [Desulfobacteraceae bacterium]|nr:patatin-like phospholipase family protein [Desulfobacteraceae bacterium]